ncbi:3-deoxy-7-phosphoheptulonate synthase [Hahella ganghwensis]|uniref:3-deoxy-7-phosphoheptulonate synthase n=1 Tax=Hahella ganghwensis TaxID=286420 RepID=UPI0003715B4A|nr:3-deoxy-7-phosphoheptulonate synthase [Hahella ganghwensis]
MNQAILESTIAKAEQQTNATVTESMSEDHLPSARQLAERYPLSDGMLQQLQAHREQINAILDGRDHRLLVVVGPCSIHDVDAAIEYGRKLAALQAKLSDRLLLVMRAYVEKPRTTIGWKGLVYDPHMDGRHDMAQGLSEARRLMVSLAELGLPLATEALSPIVSDYLQDLVSWTAIGARTTESQLHREMASGLDSSVGFKNGTDGGVEVAIQAMQSASAPHAYPTLSACGRPQLRRTSGNPHVHLVLRGGGQKPNYDEASVKRYSKILEQHGMLPRLMVDCSHDNSGKDYTRQGRVVAEVARQLSLGHSPIMGVMIESHLKEGKQKVCPGQPLEYGVSITDGCIGWDETEAVLSKLHQALS